jgi:hypothetical protein
MLYSDGNDNSGAGWSGKDGITFQGDGSVSKAALYAGHIQTKGAAEFQGQVTADSYKTSSFSVEENSSSNSLDFKYTG